MLSSCLIARNLLSGLKTCIEVSSYMRDDVAAMSHRSDSASNSFLEDNGKADADKAVCVSGSPTPPSPLYAPQKPKKIQKKQSAGKHGTRSNDNLHEFATLHSKLVGNILSTYQSHMGPGP